MKIDLLIKNAHVFRTYRQVFEKMDIAVSGEKFYYVSPLLHCKAENTVDYSGKYIIPGLIDIHMHIESSMTYPREFSRIVLPYGVTTVVSDPHEIANVFGIDGVNAFMEQDTPMDIFYAIPSCVPSTNFETETSGGIIDEAAVYSLLKSEKIICLGEVMNFKDLVSSDDTLIKRILSICHEKRPDLRIEGHCPKLTGKDLSHFIFHGVDADHTQQTAGSILEKADLGMFLELQYKSLTDETVGVVNKYNLFESIALVTDDTMPDHLLSGHLNLIIKRAIETGMPVEKAVYCSTFTPARRMGLFDRGSIAPGKLADFVVLNNLTDWKPHAVYKNGKLYKPDAVKSDYNNVFPKAFYNSVFCKAASEEDFILRTDNDCAFADVSVIQITDFGNSTKYSTCRLRVENRMLCWQEAGLSLVTIFERHGKNGNVSHALLSGGFTKQGAVATTWSHDSHNLFVIGTSIPDMVSAQHEVLKSQGAYAVSENEKITAKASLNVGGIIYDGPVETLASQLKEVRTAIENMGYVNNNVIMSISTLSLPVSPDLKITDKGLYDVKKQEFTKLILEEIL